MTLANVFFNGRFLTQRVTGVQRYGRETLAALDTLLGMAPAPSPAARWTLLVPRGAEAPALAHIEVRQVGRLRGHGWEQLELPWHARGGLLVNFGHTGPLVTARQVVTVHDASVVRMPQSFDWRFRLWYRFVVRHIVARAPCTLAVSRFSAGEAAECFGAPVERIRIVSEGWQHLDRVEADDAILDRLGLRGRPFVLAVSSPTPNKNFIAIERALRMLGASAPCCVAVGAADGGVFRAAEDAGALVRAGYVSDAELKSLYRHAAGFVFPSFYEGFGIPPLEAMACGCPVIASTAAAVRELCGDAALYFDPRQPAALAQALRALFGEPRLRERLGAAGLARARLYSWERGAALNLAAIAEALGAAAAASTTAWREIGG